MPLAASIDLESYYCRYGPAVLRRCRKLLRSEEKAADAMHEVFLVLLRNQHRLQVESPSSLLFRMATNICLNMLRTERRRSEEPGDELLMAIADAREPGEGSIARFLLGELFQREKESTRTIAVMHLVDGLTLEEVAREVGLSVSGVRKRLRMLREQLQDLDSWRSG